MTVLSRCSTSLLLCSTNTPRYFEPALARFHALSYRRAAPTPSTATPSGNAQSSNAIQTTASQIKPRVSHKPKSQQRLQKARRQSPSASHRYQQVISYATCEEYDVNALHQNLFKLGLVANGKATDAVSILGEAIWLPAWPLERAASIGDTSNSSRAIAPSDAATGEIFIFENGSFTTWGLSPSHGMRFLREVLRSPNLAQTEIDPYPTIQEESMELVVDPNRTSGPIVVGDKIILSTGSNQLGDRLGRPQSPRVLSRLAAPSSNTDYTESSQLEITNSTVKISESSSLSSSESDILIRLAVSAAMSSSPKLAAIEEEVDEHMEMVKSIPAQLVSGKKGVLNHGEIVKRYGLLFGLRHRLSLDEANLLDPPEMLWDFSELEAHYTATCRALAIDSRVKILNQKLDHALQLEDALRGLTETQKSHRLEIIIIVLIFIEIIMPFVKPPIARLVRLLFPSVAEKDIATTTETAQLAT